MELRENYDQIPHTYMEFQSMADNCWLCVERWVHRAPIKYNIFREKIFNWNGKWLAWEKYLKISVHFARWKESTNITRRKKFKASRREREKENIYKSWNVKRGQTHFRKKRKNSMFVRSKKIFFSSLFRFKKKTSFDFMFTTHKCYIDR